MAQPNTFTGIWSSLTDLSDWTTRKYIRDGQIPFSDFIFKNTDQGISQDFGAFFMDHTEFVTMFESFDVAIVRSVE